MPVRAKGTVECRDRKLNTDCRIVRTGTSITSRSLICCRQQEIHRIALCKNARTVNGRAIRFLAGLPENPLLSPIRPGPGGFQAKPKLDAWEQGKAGERQGAAENAANEPTRGSSVYCRWDSWGARFFSLCLPRPGDTSISALVQRKPEM